MLESSLTTNLNQAASNKLKDSSNYTTQRNLVKQALINVDVYEYVLNEDTSKEPLTKDATYLASLAYGKWLKGNAKAYTILHQTYGVKAMRTIKSIDKALTTQTLLKD